jgi:hypothetical protein
MQTWDKNIANGEVLKSGCFGPAQEESIRASAILCQKMG